MMRVNPIFDRLAGHLRECHRRYPQAWRQIDKLRSMRDKLGGWPEWCFCPLSGAFAVVAEQEKVSVEDLARRRGYERTADVSRIGALSSWRASQGIYVIDDDVREAVMGTPVDGALPVEILMRLPEWCCYIPTPGWHFDGGDSFESREISGFFAHLEEDTYDRRVELRILLDLDGDDPWERLSPEILHLRRGGTIEDGWAGVLAEMRKHLDHEKYRDSEAYRALERASFDKAKRLMAPATSLLLYLCSQTAEYREGTRQQFGRPSRPTPKKTKDGWRLFPPDRPKIWMVGERIGEAIRRGRQAAREWESGDRKGPRPHVRRAHWHSFWSGPRSGERRISLKWLPPIPVAMEEDTPEARMRHDRPKAVKDLGREIAATAAELEGKDERDHPEGE